MPDASSSLSLSLLLSPRDKHPYVLQTTEEIIKARQSYRSCLATSKSVIVQQTAKAQGNKQKEKETR